MSKITIEAAKKIATDSKLRAVMVIGIDNRGVAQLATYGADEEDCRVMGEFGNQFMENLPKVPFQTYFGWGNKGKPKTLSTEEYESLGMAARRYANKNTHPNAE